MISNRPRVFCESIESAQRLKTLFSTIDHITTSTTKDKTMKKELKFWFYTRGSYSEYNFFEKTVGDIISTGVFKRTMGFCMVKTFTFDWGWNYNIVDLLGRWLIVLGEEATQNRVALDSPWKQYHELTQALLVKVGKWNYLLISLANWPCSNCWSRHMMCTLPETISTVSPT